MPSFPRSLPACALVVAALLAVVAQVRAAAPAAERWLPEGTVGYVTIPDAGASRGVWKREAMAEFWSDAAMRPFREHFEKQLESRLVGPLAQLTGLHASRLAAIAEGQITLAFLESATRARTNDSGLDFVVFLDVGARTNELSAQLESAHAGTNAAALPIPELKILDVPFRSLRIPDGRFRAILDAAFPQVDDAPVPTNAVASELHWARVGSWFIAANATNQLEGILSRLRGAAPALTNHPSFTADTRRLTNTLLHGWVDGAALFKRHSGLSTNPPAAAAAAGAGPTTDRILGALGLKEVTSVSLAVRGDTHGWQTEWRLAAPVSRRTGVFKVLQFLQADALPPAWVPEDVLSFTRWRVSGPQAWRAFEKVLRDIDTAWLGVLQIFTQYAGKTEDADFDFEKGFIARLGDDWQALSLRMTNGNPSGSDLIVHGSTNSAEIHRALTLIASPTYLSTFFPPGTPSPTRIERKVDGHPMITLAMPPMPWREGATGMVHLVERDGRVGISGSQSSVDVFFGGTNPPPSLVKRPDFQAAVERAGGGGNGWLGYYLERDLARRFFNGAQQPTELVQEALGWAAYSQGATRVVAGLAGWLDFGLLPPFATVARHFGFRVESGRLDDAGFQLTTQRPNPPNYAPPPVPVPVPVPKPPAPVSTPAVPAPVPSTNPPPKQP